MSGGGRGGRKGRIQGWRLSRTAGWKSRGGVGGANDKEEDVEKGINKE